MAEPVSLDDWTGTWELQGESPWGSLLETLAAAWSPGLHRCRVAEADFTIEEASAAREGVAFRADLDGELRESPLPPGLADAPRCRSAWVEKPACFKTEVSELTGPLEGKGCAILRRLVSPSELRITVSVFDQPGGAASTDPVWASFRKTSALGPAPVAWLRAKGKPLDTAEDRVKVLEQVFRMVGEGLEEISAAQLQDRVVPPRFDGTAKMIQGACKFYQKLVPEWMKPERLEDTCPDMLKNGVEADWFVMNEPKGVGIVVVPWNAPVTLACIPTLGMLAAGNRVVIKTPELTPAVSAVLRRLFHRYLYGYVWVEEGGKEAVERLIDEGADHLVFTGGGEIAKVVAARCAQQLTPVTLELGGKSPVFVDRGLSDKMLDSVVTEILETKVAKTGQFCCAHDYAMVHEEVHALFCEKLAKAIEALGERRNILLIARRQYEAVKRKLEEAGAECLPPLGGPYVPDDEAMTLPMTALLAPALDKSVLTTEIFGPLLPILKIKGVDEAIDLVNNNPVGKPLIAYCYTEDQASVDAFLTRTSSGNVAINGGPQRFHLNFNAGFGGIGPSGSGVSMWGREALREFSNRKHVLHAKNGFARSFFSGPPAPPK